MTHDLTQFHWLRPEWLWLLIALFILVISVGYFNRKQSSWQKVVSPHLLQFLIQSEQNQTKQTPFWLIALMGSLIIIAVSGPSFRQKPVPVFQSESARVILLDLSLSMEVADIKPSRVERAKHKIMDILDKNKEGSIALVVYAGDAFIISPLTSDANTIATMVPMLSTGIMPVLGSRPDRAINKAIELLNNAHQNAGQVIWLTDGIDQEYIDPVVQSIKNNKAAVSILAIGTEQGAPIPLPNNSGFLKDTEGNIILPKLDSDNLKEIAQQTNGQYIELTQNQKDVDLIMQLLKIKKDQDAKGTEDKINRWIDDGYWITLPIIFFAIFLLFGKKQTLHFNSIASLLPLLLGSLVMSSLYSPNSQASLWDDLWKTKDQQAQAAFSKKDYSDAAKLFENNQWKASAEYKKGDYSQATEHFSQLNDLESTYNYANSLAKSKQFEKAIEAYDKVLTQNPKHEDAKFNKKIVEDLLKQQKQQQKNKDKNKNNKDQDKENKKDKKQQSDQNKKSDKNSKDDQQQDQKDEKKQSKKDKSHRQKTQEEKEKEQQQAKLEQDKRDKSEKDQALKHWLDKIHDDPGGLLRRKMIREYQQRGGKQKEKKLW